MACAKVQGLRAPPVLGENQGSVPSTYMVSLNCLLTPVWGSSTLLAPRAPDIHMLPKSYMQAEHMHRRKNKFCNHMHYPVTFSYRYQICNSVLDWGQAE